MFVIGNRCRIVENPNVGVKWHNKVVVITDVHILYNPNLYTCVFFDDETHKRIHIALYENELELINGN